MQDEVVVEWTPLASRTPGRGESLSEAERERWARMAPGPGDRWAAGRTWVRERLGAHLGVPPAAVGLGAEPTGRPVLLDAAAHLSISHTDRVIVLALSAAVVGVDVEGLPPADEDLLALAALVGSAAEVAELGAVDPAARPRAFQRWWVAKEAILKARGTGFLADARGVEVGVASPTAPEGMHLRELGPLLDGEFCTLATFGTPGVLRVTSV